MTYSHTYRHTHTLILANIHTDDKWIGSIGFSIDLEWSSQGLNQHPSN